MQIKKKSPIRAARVVVTSYNFNRIKTIKLSYWSNNIAFLVVLDNNYTPLNLNYNFFA